jgi:phosphoglycolate phosphatase
MRVRKLLLFDIDGTLVATGGAGTRAMARAFADVFQITDALEGVTLAGRTDRAITEDVLARRGVSAGVPPGRFDDFCAAYVACLREEIVRETPAKRVLPGVRSLLGALAGRPDVELALLTGNLEEGARIKLDHFNLWTCFRWGAFGHSVVDRAELMPLALARARERGLGDVSPESVLVIGDTPDDVSCARSGGARAVAVATGPYSRDALLESGADVVLDDLSDLDGFLRLLGPA